MENEKNFGKKKIGSGFIVESTQDYQLDGYFKEPVILCNYNRESYIFTMNVEAACLPKSIGYSLDALCQVVSRQIVLLTANETLSVKKCLEDFLKACSALVINLQVDEKFLVSLLQDSHSALYSKQTDLNIEYLNKILDISKNFFNIKQKAKKLLIFSLDFDQERQKFVEFFMNAWEIDLETAKKKFFEIFFYFLPSESDGWAEDFITVFKDLEREKEILIEKSQIGIFNRLRSYLHMCMSYMKIQISCLRITELGVISSEHEIEWYTICSLILQKTSVKLGKPVDISMTELIIPLFFGQASCLIYFSKNDFPKIIEFWGLREYFIMPGSKSEEIFIFNQEICKVSKYRLESCRLELCNEFSFWRDYHEKIVSVVYLEGIECFFAVNNNHRAFTRNLDSPILKEFTVQPELGNLIEIILSNYQKLVLLNGEVGLYILNLNLYILGFIPLTQQRPSIIPIRNNSNQLLSLSQNSIKIIKFLLKNTQNINQSILHHTLTPCEYFLSQSHLKNEEILPEYLSSICSSFEFSSNLHESPQLSLKLSPVKLTLISPKHL